MLATAFLLKIAWATQMLHLNIDFLTVGGYTLLTNRKRASHDNRSKDLKRKTKETHLIAVAAPFPKNRCDFREPLTK